ncbi:hypothetical protein K466DRAFT_394947 [Polyporus arcularius HHB13444]|uniref:Uncharacterized protein n=1 Tax=Polyporus arcularius HHB13444 TaxID=1314778 RepID=A0A5C3PKF8_9APHY|nr:hypothetical protein K466DRAFT_394947 [Polyporus arcularius HHB13444]
MEALTPVLGGLRHDLPRYQSLYSQLEIQTFFCVYSHALYGVMRTMTCCSWSVYAAASWMRNRQELKGTIDGDCWRLDMYEDWLRARVRSKRPSWKMSRSCVREACYAVPQQVAAWCMLATDRAEREARSTGGAMAQRRTWLAGERAQIMAAKADRESKDKGPLCECDYT